MRAWLGAACAVLAAGCANYTAPLEAQAKRDPGKGVLFGRFQKTGWPNFALVIENVGRTRQYVIRFPPESGVAAVEVEPDRYEITQFMATDIVHEEFGRRPLQGWPYGAPFNVQPDRIYYLSDFAGAYSSGPLSLPFDTQPNAFYRFSDLAAARNSTAVSKGTYTVWKMEPALDRFDAARAELLEKFPNLRGLPVARAFNPK